MSTDKDKEYKHQWYLDHKEITKKRAREYTKNNKEKVSKQKKEYYEKNAEEIKEKQKNYYYDNKEKVCDYHKQYYAENKEKISEKSKKYYAETKDKSIERAKVFQQKTRYTLNRKYYKGKSCAKKRGIEWNLPLEEYTELMKDKTCFYCGGSLDNSTGISLDRADNNLGYTKDNCVPCCYFCNSIKNAIITKEELIEIVKLLKVLRSKENIWENIKIKGNRKQNIEEPTNE